MKAIDVAMDTATKSESWNGIYYIHIQKFDFKRNVSKVNAVSTLYLQKQWRGPQRELRSRK